MNNQIIKSEIGTLVKAADTELLEQKREQFRNRAKGVLRFKERMEDSIAQCEKDLEEARKKLADFKAKLALVDEKQDMDAFEELEKQVCGHDTKFYQPATVGYVQFTQSYQGLSHAISASGTQYSISIGNAST